MFKRVIHFVKYNNAFTFGIMLFMFSFGGVMAASPEVRQGVAGSLVGETQSLRSVDNSYIVSANLNNYMPQIQVIGVTEDADHYYVAYTLGTIDLVDAVWQPTQTNETMKVAKAVLGKQDLGLYVTHQLRDIVEWRLSRLKETQTIERRNGQTAKVIATAYSGLVGRFLDVKEERFPGYDPVIKPPKEPPPKPLPPPEQTPEPVVIKEPTPRIPQEPEPPTAPAPEEEVTAESPEGQSSSSGSEPVQEPVGADPAVSPIDDVPPSLTILGENPITLPSGATYSDLGAVITDNVNTDLAYTISVNGEEVVSVFLDTSRAGEYAIVYTATDLAGNTSSATRTVTVSAPAITPVIPDVPPETEPVMPDPASAPENTDRTAPEVL